MESLEPPSLDYIKFVYNATKCIEHFVFDLYCVLSPKRMNSESVAAEESSGDEFGAKIDLR